MSGFRTSSVFRFSKEYDSLTKILKTGIIPNFCEENLSFGETEFVVGIPMASFCDIPITLLDEHNNRYGNYGLALSKEWAIEKGLTPIMYIANNDVLQSIYYHHQRNKKVLDWYNRENVKKQLANDTLIKGFPLGDFVKMMNAKQEHAINTHIIGYLKQYQGEYQKRPINNYTENEWRYLVPDLKGTEWFWSKDDYMKWRFPNNNMKAAKPAPSDALRKYTLTFENKDISYVLIKNDEFKTRLIEYIKGLKTIGGNEITDESQTDDLISKIITLEQVKSDF